MANKADMITTFGMLAALYPNFANKMDEDQWTDMRKAYLLILGDLPADLLAQAAIIAASRGTFFPAAAEIRTAAVEIRNQIEDVPTVQDAWAEVCRVLQAGGVKGKQARVIVTNADGTREEMGSFIERRAPGPEDWSCPLIGQAIDAIGGWRQLRESEFPTADRARFAEAYQVYLDRYRTDRDMLPCIRQTINALRLVSGGRSLSLSEIGQRLQAIPAITSFNEE